MIGLRAGVKSILSERRPENIHQFTDDVSLAIIANRKSATAKATDELRTLTEQSIGAQRKAFEQGPIDEAKTVVADLKYTVNIAGLDTTEQQIAAANHEFERLMDEAQTMRARGATSEADDVEFLANAQHDATLDHIKKNSDAEAKARADAIKLIEQKTQVEKLRAAGRGNDATLLTMQHGHERELAKIEDAKQRTVLAELQAVELENERRRLGEEKSQPGGGGGSSRATASTTATRNTEFQQVSASRTSIDVAESNSKVDVRTARRMNIIEVVGNRNGDLATRVSRIARQNPAIAPALRERFASVLNPPAMDGAGMTSSGDQSTPDGAAQELTRVEMQANTVTVNADAVNIEGSDQAAKGSDASPAGSIPISPEVEADLARIPMPDLSAIDRAIAAADARIADATGRPTSSASAAMEAIEAQLAEGQAAIDHAIAQADTQIHGDDASAFAEKAAAQLAELERPQAGFERGADPGRVIDIDAATRVEGAGVMAPDIKTTFEKQSQIAEQSKALLKQIALNTKSNVATLV